MDVVFIHGMFMTPKCWDGWVRRFRAAGHECSAPPWPGREGTVAELRARHPDPALAKLTLTAIVDSYAERLRDRSPALIGHSMGGLVAQLLLARGIGRCAVAIDSAPPKGVVALAWSFVKSNWPVLSPFADLDEPLMLSFEQFRYAFVHALPPEEQRAAYEEHVVPESRRVGRAPLGNEAKIDFSRPHAPLLFVSGEIDKIIPAKLNRANAAKYKGPKDYREFPGRTHYLLGQGGWEEIADCARAFIEKNAPESDAPRRSGEPRGAPTSG
jgi:pimeloyl-ACP methyl ester carboxylesterase